MSAYIDVTAAIKEAENLLEQKAKIMEKVAIIRTDLRNSITMGVATQEQKEWIEGQFPQKERITDPAAQLAKAQERVQELQTRNRKGSTPAAKAA